MDRIFQKQMDKNLENRMETGIMQGFVIILTGDLSKGYCSGMKFWVIKSGFPGPILMPPCIDL